MSSRSDDIIVKELIYVDDKAIMNNMENEADTIKLLLEVIRNLEARLTALDGQ